MEKDKTLRKQKKNDQLVNQDAGIIGACSFNFLNYIIKVGKSNYRDHQVQCSQFINKKAQRL